MEKNRPVTNIIDLLDCRDVRNFMTVNGFAWNGSAYDRFRALCLCAERQPNAPIILRILAYFENTFGCDLSMNSSTCKQIWCDVSERLFLGDVKPNAFHSAEKTYIGLPTAQPQKCFLLNDLHIQAEDWPQWKRAADEVLCRVMNEGNIVTVALPKGYVFEKTNLYKANRAITEGDFGCPSWVTQLVYLMCDFCASHNIRGGILCLPDGAELCDILQHVSKLTKLPSLYVGVSAPNSETLLPVCRLILAERECGQDGVPPVLLFSPN